MGSLVSSGLISSRMWKPSTNGFENGKRHTFSDEGRILEGVSSLHSWIKKNTMVPPTEKMKKLRALYDEVYKHIQGFFQPFI